MTIQINRNGPLIPTDYSWQFGIGNDHAYQMLRTDVCNHVKLAHDELGFRYIRFHGIFDDDMLVVQCLSDYREFKKFPGASRIREVSFRHIVTVFDNVLKCGMKPFVELSFMPKALASGTKTGLRYENNITLPRKMSQWSELIEQFIVLLLQRYGNEEVESWYFEVWNEPDLQDYFFDGTQEDYFKLYAATVQAIKKVNSNLRVGGPSTSACRWISDFCVYCKENDVPYDFVSTHHYPGDPFGNVVTNKRRFDFLVSRLNRIKYGAKRKKQTQETAEKNIELPDALRSFFFSADYCRNLDGNKFQAMDNQARLEVGNTPLYITEWNSMAVYTSPVHDEKYSAAFIVKTVMDLSHKIDGCMFWCCSDIFGEMFILGRPFHGSFGIINNDGIPKPNFWAFKILSQLLPQRLKNVTHVDGVEYAVFVGENKIQILVYAQDFDYEKDEEYTLNFEINTSATHVTKQIIDTVHCNPKAAWQKLGQPNLMTKEQIADIKQSTRLRRESHPFVACDGGITLQVSLRTNDVVLLEIDV